jgi:hypothetical protein
LTNVHLLLRLASTALGTTAALDSTRLGTLDVVGGNPVLVIGLGAGGDSRGFVVRGDSNGFGLARCLLATSRRLTLLLREVWDNPDSVEEIADTHSACEEEEVEEEAIAGCKRQNQSTSLSGKLTVADRRYWRLVRQWRLCR